MLLVRHGVTAENITYTLIGRTDVSLHRIGVVQGEAVGESLRSVSLTAIYTSPLRRSIETAQIISRHHALEIQTCDGLTEIDLGIVDGVSSFVAYEQHQALMGHALDESLPDFCFPGGESRSDALVRFQTSLAEIVARHPNQMVCVVTHGGPLGLWLAQMHREPLGRFRGWQPTHGSITRVRANGAGNHLLLSRNEIAHLPADLPTLIEEARNNML